jgi:ABC-type Na+ transport system ATPase subunit NatA
MGEVNLLSDDLAIVHNGRMIYCGTFADFKAGSTEASLEEEFIRRLETAG